MTEVKCPHCGGEVENGFLITLRPLWWDTKKHTLTAAGAEQVTDFTFIVRNIETYRCEKCKFIMFEYRENEGAKKTR
jgi:hypothetical protein